MDLNF